MPLNSELHAAVQLQQAGRYREALHILERLPREKLENREQCTVLLCEATCLEALKQLDKARNRLLMVRQLDDSGSLSFFVDLREIYLYSAEDNYDQAIELGKRFLNKYRRQLRDPEYQDNADDVEFEVAAALIRSGRPEEAIGPLLKLLGRAP